jgi:hypothetical protein
MSASLKNLIVATTLVIVVLAAPCVAAAAEDPLTPGAIIEAGDALDGERVEMQGEAIGDKLRADAEHRWVNVLGGGSAIGVYMTDEMAAEIGRLGLYTTFGDTLQITGVVNHACTQHAGEFDIHAEEVSLVERGGDRENPVSPWKAGLGLGLLLLGAVEFRIYKRLKERAPV